MDFSNLNTKFITFRQYSIVLFFLLSMVHAIGQSLDSLRFHSLDFAVSDNPVFSFLSENPDQIITPSSSRIFSISNMNFNSFGIEISPELFTPNLSSQEYKKNTFFYRMRFSVGTNKLQDGRIQIAEGIRFVFRDGTDLKTNKEFNEKLLDISKKEDYFNKKAQTIFWNKVKNKEKTFDNIASNITENQFKDTCDMCREGKEDIICTEYYYIVDSLSKGENFSPDYIREEFKQKLWNAKIVEGGIVIMEESLHSQLDSITLKRGGIWFSEAGPIGKRAKWLLGGQVQFIDSWKNPYLSIGSRLYLGNYDQNGFIQISYEWSKYDNTTTKNLTAGLGVVFRAVDGIWTTLSGGFVIDCASGNISFVPKLTFGFGGLEKRK